MDHGKGPVDGIGGTIKQIAANLVPSCKGMITDSSTFVDIVESKSKVKVFHITSQDFTDRMAEFGLCQLVKNAPALSGISGAHHLEFSGNIVIMHTYTNATYTINNLLEDNLQFEAVDEAKVEINSGMFVLVAYNFITTSEKQCTKNIVAMFINTSEEVIEVHYAKCVGQSLKQFALVKNDTVFVTKTDHGIIGVHSPPPPKILDPP